MNTIDSSPCSTERDSYNPSLCIVSAYYRLNLAQSSAKSYKASRNSRTYLEFFRFWAGARNPLVIYLSPDDTDYDDGSLDEFFENLSQSPGGERKVRNIEEAILCIRGEFGLRDQTIIVRAPLDRFDQETLALMRTTFADYDQAADRFDPIHPPHTSPEYDYLNYCKSFFILDAFDRGLIRSKNALWLDFGYGVGEMCYRAKGGIDFELRAHPVLDANRFTLFSLGEPDTRPLSQILIRGSGHFYAGNTMYGNEATIRRFNMRIKEAARAFVSFNTMDDDQKMYIWIARNYPHECQVVWIGGWFDGILYFDPSLQNLENQYPVISTNIIKDADNPLDTLKTLRSPVLPCNNLRIFKYDFSTQFAELLPPPPYQPMHHA